MGVKAQNNKSQPISETRYTLSLVQRKNQAPFANNYFRVLGFIGPVLESLFTFE